MGGIGPADQSSRRAVGRRLPTLTLPLRPGLLTAPHDRILRGQGSFQGPRSSSGTRVGSPEAYASASSSTAVRSHMGIPRR